VAYHGFRGTGGRFVSPPKGPGLHKFVLNPAFPEEFSQEARFITVMRSKALAVAELANHNLEQFASGPFMPRKEGNPFVVEEDAESVKVVNTDYGGLIYEFGAVRTPPYAPLRRAVRAAGLTFTEHGDSPEP
jgi:hypothetical protein